MGRIRSIKPEFFQDEDLAELSPLHRILFAGLWTEADREGRLEDRPKRLKAMLLPYDEADVDEMLQDLADHRTRFIQRYEVEGRRFILIPRFTKHQRPNSRESTSVIPAPPEQAQAAPLSVLKALVSTHARKARASCSV